MSALNKSVFDAKHNQTIYQKRTEKVTRWEVTVGFVLPSKRVTDLRAMPGGKCPMLCVLTESSRGKIPEAVFFSLS